MGVCFRSVEQTEIFRFDVALISPLGDAARGLMNLGGNYEHPFSANSLQFREGS